LEPYMRHPTHPYIDSQNSTRPISSSENLIKQQYVFPKGRKHRIAGVGD
jgi:hypothetical protein